jgi:hypothetical protein
MLGQPLYGLFSGLGCGGGPRVEQTQALNVQARRKPHACELLSGVSPGAVLELLVNQLIVLVSRLGLEPRTL